MMIIRPSKSKKNQENKKHIIVDGQKIDEIDQFKMLGYIIDNKLSNEEHCKYIIKKSRKTLSAIRRLSSKTSKASATKVLKSVLIGRLAYGGFLYLQCVLSQRKSFQTKLRIVFC